MQLKVIRNGRWTVEVWSDGWCQIHSSFRLKRNLNRWVNFNETSSGGNLPIYVRVMVRQCYERWLVWKVMQEIVKTIENKEPQIPAI